MAERNGFDVAVVGASVGGCTAARLFGLAGLRVALIEKRPDPDAYKVVCTHQILSSAVPTIERLGLAGPLAERGAMRSHVAAWSPFGGWMRFPTDVVAGYGVTRQTLDPILRDLAAGTPGVEMLLGRTVTAIRGDGVEVTTPDHRDETIRARLVVGADGRGSSVARMAGVPGRVRRHGRFFYFAYWRGIPNRSDKARIWFLDPDGGADFPNEDDLNVVTVAPTKQRLPEFRADPETAYRRMVGALPDGPDIEHAEQASRLLGKLDVPNVLRTAAHGNVAFVGDAAIAADPSFGVGCGWAFQTAEWLVDHTAEALRSGGGDLDRALARYRRTFLRRLGLEYWLIADMSTGRRLRANERATFRATAQDPVLARAVEEVTNRRRSSVHLLHPRVTARILRPAA